MVFDYNDNQAAAQVDTDIPFATDSMLTKSGTHPILPFPYYVQWWYALGTTLTRARLSAPRVKPITRPVLCPTDQGATPSDPLKISEYFRHPILLNPTEEIQMLRTKTSAVAEQDHVVLAVGDNNRQIPQSDMYLARFTTTMTAVANAWTVGTLVADDTLAAGRYSIVGMRCNAATAVAARLIFPGAAIQGSYPAARPGVICRTGTGQSDWIWSRFGNMGEYGQFESFALPVLEIMDTAAGTNPEVLLDICNVRMGARQ